MKKKVEVGKTYIGVVEDIKDPDKMGRVKVRVLDIYEQQPLEDIPWASPWKDLGGGQFSLPELGKVVIVVFDQGDSYKPEYIFTEHWNINLETKLKSLGDEDYQSMRSVIFDHKTQIYANDGEGLKLDHKFNNINIKDGGINLNLKDNSRVLNLGDSTANQQAILGNHFLDWFDSFVDALMSNTAFLGNAGAPVLTNPSLVRVLSQYKSQKASTFLSHHVNIIDNNQSSTVKNETREETAQAGDTWKSTTQENTITTVSDDTNKPVDGPKPEYDENFSEPPIVTGGSASAPIPPKDIPSLPDKSLISSNPKIEKLIWFMKSKEYVLYERPYELNIIAFRSKESITIEKGGIEFRSPAPVTNVFDEEMHVFYKNENGNWDHCEYTITTVPGFLPGQKVLPNNVAILRLGQYVEQLRMANFGGDTKHKCLVFDNCAIHRNTSIDSYDYDSPTEIGSFPISIHRSSDIAQAEFVYNYSEGSQVFKSLNQYESFINLCDKQITLGKKDKFSYTLAFKSDYEKYPAPKEQREKLTAKLGKELNSTIKSAVSSAKQGLPSISNLKTIAQETVSKFK